MCSVESLSSGAICDQEYSASLSQLLYYDNGSIWEDILDTFEVNTGVALSRSVNISMLDQYALYLVCKWSSFVALQLP